MNNFFEKNKKTITAFLIFIFPIIVLFGFYVNTKISEKEETINKNRIVQKDTKKENDYFDKIQLKAKGAIVKDLNTNEIIFQKNSEISMPIASITKLMTVITAIKMSNKENVEISFDDLLQDGDDGFFPGEIFNRKDLIDFTLIKSSNDGASALLANALYAFTDITEQEKRNKFIEKMNKIAKKIGMNNTYFYNETGLDISNDKAGAYGSASDIAKMLEYIIEENKNYIENTSKNNIVISSNYGINHNANNTNPLTKDLPNLILSKTGYTDLAGGNLAVVIDPFLNRPFAIVVLGSSTDGRFEDVKKLSEATIEYLKNN